MKLLGSVLLILAVLFVQVGSVAAAPQIQGSTSTIDTIETQTDENGVTTVLVTYDDGQSVRISLQYAIDLGLIDPVTQEPVAEIPTEVTIDPDQVIPDEEPAGEDAHPISKLLAAFFFPEDKEEMATAIDSFHNGDYQFEGDESEALDQVFGFGVIAQALWMTRDEDGNADIDLTALILEAKKTGEYDTEALSEYFDFGDDPPTNWGQFKKAVKEDKGKHNLGEVISGHADDDASADQQQSDKGNDKDNKKNKGSDGNNGKGNDGNKPGKGNNKP